MTWHQWHQMASRSRSTKRCSRFAWENTPSDQGSQFSLLDGEPASCAKVVEASSTARTNALRFTSHPQWNIRGPVSFGFKINGLPTNESRLRGWTWDDT